MGVRIQSGITEKNTSILKWDMLGLLNYISVVCLNWMLASKQVCIVSDASVRISSMPMIWEINFWHRLAICRFVKLHNLICHLFGSYINVWGLFFRKCLTCSILNHLFSGACERMCKLGSFLFALFFKIFAFEICSILHCLIYIILKGSWNISDLICI